MITEQIGMRQNRVVVKMKKTKTFIISETVMIIIKVLGGFITNSYTMLSSAIYDISLLTIMLVTSSTTENTKSQNIISSLCGFIFTLLGLGIIFLSSIANKYKMSLWIILFVFLSIIIRYLINCIYTNSSYQKKKGILSISLINSNTDFYNYGIILGALILFKIHRWIPIFKYADILGTILISLLTIYKGFKIIAKSIRNLEGNSKVEEMNIQELEKCEEIKKIKKLSISNYGGISKYSCELVLKEGINMIDLNTFVVNLQDFLLKSTEIAQIELVEDKKIIKRKQRVRSLKQDARNSRSRNSKANAKKKNTREKNKKN